MESNFVDWQLLCRKELLIMLLLLKKWEAKEISARFF